MEIEAVRQNDNFSAAVEVPIALDRSVSTGSSGCGSSDSQGSPGQRISEGSGSRRNSSGSQGSKRTRKNSKPDLKVNILLFELFNILLGFQRFQIFNLFS